MRNKIENAISWGIQKGVNEAYGQASAEQDFYKAAIERRNNGETWTALARDFNSQFGTSITADAIRGRVNTAAKHQDTHVVNHNLNVPSKETEIFSVIKGKDGLKYQLIDLGLPSGTLWADKNVGGKNTYFSYGETTPVRSDNMDGAEPHIYFSPIRYKSKIDKKYSKSRPCKYTSYMYDVVEPYTSSLNIENDKNFDAAYINMGNGCCIPSVGDFEELLMYTTQTIIKDGIKFVSKINGNFIIFNYDNDKETSYMTSSVSTYWHNNTDNVCCRCLDMYIEEDEVGKSLDYSKNKKKYEDTIHISSHYRHYGYFVRGIYKTTPKNKGISW